MVSDAEVEGVATRAQQWMALLAAHRTVAPGSSLAVDDAACPVLPCSRLAWVFLTWAHSRLLAVDEAQRADALREILVATSHAMAVLAPGPSARTFHGLRLAWTVLDGQHDDPTLDAIGKAPDALARTEVERLLAERGFDASPRWRAQSSIRIAGAIVSADAPDPEAFANTLRNFWRGRFTAEGDLAVAEQAVVLMWERAADIWRRRSVPPRPAPNSPYVGRVRF